jgi:hypothetical protein
MEPNWERIWKWVVCVILALFALVTIITLHHDFATVPTQYGSGVEWRRIPQDKENADIDNEQYFNAEGRYFGGIDQQDDGSFKVTVSCGNSATNASNEYFRSMDEAKRAVEKDCSSDKEF